MKNLKMYQKLSVAFLLIIALTLVLGGVSIKYLDDMRTTIDDMYKHPFTVSTTVITMKSDIIAIHREMKDIAMDTSEIDIAESEKIVNEIELKVLSNFTVLEERFLGDKTEITKFKNSFIGWKDIRDEVIGLTRNGEDARAMSITKGKGADKVAEILGYANYLETFAYEKADSFHSGAMESVDTQIRMVIMLLIDVVVMAVAIIIFLTRSITKPLNETTRLAEEIAAGNLEGKVTFGDRNDEIGVLIRAFSQMKEYLSAVASLADKIALGNLDVEVVPRSEKDVLCIALLNMVENIREMALITEKISEGDLKVKVEPKSDKDVMGNALAAMVSSLKGVVGEITEGVNIIASSSSEIMASTAQVASGAIETATAINETTNSVEQFKKSTQFASKKFTEVSDTTQNTIDISNKGIVAVNESINGMIHIQDQVESVAHSLVRLSEQSQAIGEIIASVNDLAEQSNLLAVNAAIEATKAGEFGRGFSVVAQEVKILAEQSKEATSNVRIILNDILKATNNAVMATEQGNKAVETGVLQSKAAGETIRLMAEHIENIAESATQVSITGQQQIDGVDQVAVAMENILQASEQNVEGTKQVEATVQNLHELGQRLKLSVDKFRI